MSLDLIAERNGILDPSLALYLPLHKKDGNQFISDDAYGHLCTVTVGATAIDVGNAATNRSAAGAVGRTYIDLANAANYTGRITSVEIWAATDMTGARVGSFYLMGGTTYKCRDSVTIGNVTSGSKQTFTTGVNFAIKAGDFIGIYSDTGTIEMDASGGSGIVGIFGEYIDAGDIVEYTAFASYAISLYATGTSSGKLWTPQGHVFGGDDYIQAPIALLNIINGAAGLTVMLWFKVDTFPAGGATNNALYFPIDESHNAGIGITLIGTGTLLRCGGRSQATDTFQKATDITFSDTTSWHFLAGFFDYPNDTINQVLDGALGAPASVTFGSTSYANSSTTKLPTLGANSTPANYLIGREGMAMVETRLMTFGETEQVRLATKWRYT